MPAVNNSNARWGEAGTVTVFRTGSIAAGWSGIGQSLLLRYFFLFLALP